jgi:hypothetical protein
VSYLDLQDERAAMAELQWSALSGDLLGGLTHALSNRIGLLTVLSEHLSVDTSDVEASAQMLREECTKLTTVLRLIRLLPYQGGPDVPPAEPMSMAECLEDAVLLLQHHRVTRNTALAVNGMTGLPAVWGQRMEMRRVLLTLLFAAMRDAVGAEQKGEQDVSVSVSCWADADSVTLELRGTAMQMEFLRLFWLTAVHFAHAAGAELEAVGNASATGGTKAKGREGKGKTKGKSGDVVGAPSGPVEWPVQLRVPTAAAVRARRR